MDAAGFGKARDRLRALWQRRLRPAVWFIGQPLLYAGLWVAHFYRPTFHETSRYVYKVADRLGVYPVIDHYHEPLIRPQPAPPVVLRQLPAIDLRVPEQLELLASLTFQDELLRIPRNYVDLATPYYENLALVPGDAQMVHNLIRHYRPRRIIEVGAGESSRFATNALRINELHGAERTRMTCVEPFEAPWLESLGAEVIRRKVEDLPLAFFADLGPSDILFIDSSHVSRPGGDVSFIFTEVLPSLKPGVVVHVHDVFTPRHYPQEWIRRRRLWDEQYLLEALLTRSDWLGIVAAVNYLHVDHPTELAKACPVAFFGEAPSSMWLQVLS